MREDKTKKGECSLCDSKDVEVFENPNWEKEDDYKAICEFCAEISSRVMRRPLDPVLISKMLNVLLRKLKEGKDEIL